MFDFISYNCGEEVVNKEVCFDELIIDEEKTSITIKIPMDLLPEEQQENIDDDVVDFVILEDRVGCQKGERDMDYYSVMQKLTKLTETATKPLTNKDFHEAMKK